MAFGDIYGHPRFLVCRERWRNGVEPCASSADVVAWLKQRRSRLKPVLPDVDLKHALTFDWSAPNDWDMDRVEEFTREIFAAMDAAGAKAGIGKYNEDRHCYRSDLFQPTNNGVARTLHIGVDLFARPGTAIAAPLSGRIHSFCDNANPLDYGPTIILEHVVAEANLTFYTLYGHLSRESLNALSAGQIIESGEVFAAIGNYPVNGNWPPHLHIQLIADLFDQSGDFPGVVPATEATLWQSICPDPRLVIM